MFNYISKFFILVDDKRKSTLNLRLSHNVGMRPLIHLKSLTRCSYWALLLCQTFWNHFKTSCVSHDFGRTLASSFQNGDKHRSFQWLYIIPVIKSSPWPNCCCGGLFCCCGCCCWGYGCDEWGVAASNSSNGCFRWGLASLGGDHGRDEDCKKQHHAGVGIKFISLHLLFWALGGVTSCLSHVLYMGIWHSCQHALQDIKFRPINQLYISREESDWLGRI